MAVVEARPQSVEERSIGVARRASRSWVNDLVTGQLLTDETCSIDLARLTQRTRRRVDGQRRLVAEQVTDHRRQHEAERRVDGWHVDASPRRGEPVSPSFATTIGVALWAL